MNEQELSIALGLSRDMLKEIREAYEEGLHWNRIEANKPKELWEIEWTPEGISNLKEGLGLDASESLSTPTNKKGKVWQKYANPRIIGVKFDDEPEKIHSVLCRESSKFAIHMPVDARWDGARWCIVRHPRFNGKY